MNAPLEDANAGLIKQARAGDARAFEALAREVERPLYRHVQRIVGESADAEDCVQDALFSAWRSIRAFEGFAYEEIAVITAVEIGTVKSRIHRGRLAVRNALVAKGWRGSAG